MCLDLDIFNVHNALTVNTQQTNISTRHFGLSLTQISLQKNHYNQRQTEMDMVIPVYPAPHLPPQTHCYMGIKMALNTCFVPPLDLSTVCIHPWNSRNLPLKHCSLSPTFRTCQVTGKTKRNISITRKQEVQSFSHSYSTDLSNLALYVCVCACVHACMCDQIDACNNKRQTVS